ncbi:MAG: T9SS type A sorting domain-containing protein [Bacteroidota bacterium]
MYAAYQGPLDLPDTNYQYIDSDVLIFKHALESGAWRWHKKIGEPEVWELVGKILIDEQSRVISSASFNADFVGYTYLDTIKIIDRYPLTLAQWQYIGYTSPENLPRLRTDPFDDRSAKFILPNPSQGQVWLKGLPKTSLVRIKLSNLEGKTMYQRTLPTSDGTLQLNLTPYPNGLYVIIIETNDQITQHKVVLLR